MNQVAPRQDDNFIRCYSRFSRSVFKMVNRYVDNPDIAEELMQDIYLKLYQRSVPLDPDHPTTGAYLLTIARNAAFDHIKNMKRQVAVHSFANIEEIESNDPDLLQLDNYVINGEIISTLHDVIESLPSDEKEVILERVFLNKQICQIARERRSSTYLTGKLLRSAMRVIRTRMQPYFAE